MTEKPTIDKVITKGITTSTIKDALTANQMEIHNAKKELLKPLVEDE